MSGRKGWTTTIGSGLAGFLLLGVPDDAAAQNAAPPAADTAARAPGLRPAPWRRADPAPALVLAAPSAPDRTALDKAQSGGSFPGATSAPDVAAAQGAAAKPLVAGTAVPAGTFDTGKGFSFQFNYTSESAGNPVGGARRGAAYADQILTGADANLEKLLGFRGATIHFIGTQRNGRNLSNDAIGNSLSPQEIFDGFENTRLTILSYEQKLFDDRLSFEIGRLPAQGAFLVSPLYCNFQNVGVCGSPEIAFANTNFTFLPTSTWGGHAKYFFDDKIFFHAGAFQVQPSTVLRNDHGLDFGLSGTTGVIVPLEFGYTTTAANDPYPRNYGIGAMIDRSSYSDPVNDSAGGRTLFSGLPPRNRFGRNLVFARFDQTVWKPDPNGTRALQIFGVAGVGVGGRQTQDFQLEAGAVWTGPLASRPFDALGLVVTAQHYSSSGLADVRAARASQGLRTNIASDQILIELNYGIQVTPAIRATPNLQYIINPDNIRDPFRRSPIPNAFVIGGKLSVDFFTLAGLAKGPGSK